MRRSCPYQIQAANAATPADTDWPQIAALYGGLVRRTPTPVVQLNAAVALAMCGRFDEGLDWVNRLAQFDELQDYHLLWAARADLLRRSGRNAEAAEDYRRALELVKTAAERIYLERRLLQVQNPGPNPGTAAVSAAKDAPCTGAQ